MADSQPDNNPAPDGTTPAQDPQATPPAAPATDTKPQGPEEKTASKLTIESPSEDLQGLFKGLNIDPTNISEADLLKLSNQALTSKKASSEKELELKSLKEQMSNVVAPQPPQETNPFVAPATQPDTTDVSQSAAQVSTPSSTEQRFLMTHLATVYPEIKDQIVSGELYKGMRDFGLSMTNSDGSINIDAIEKFASHQVEVSKMNARIGELEQTSPGELPGAGSQPPEDADMTKQMAQAIVLQDKEKTHPRYQEALQFLQS